LDPTTPEWVAEEANALDEWEKSHEPQEGYLHRRGQRGDLDGNYERLAVAGVRQPFHAVPWLRHVFEVGWHRLDQSLEKIEALLILATIHQSVLRLVGEFPTPDSLLWIEVTEHQKAYRVKFCCWKPPVPADDREVAFLERNASSSLARAIYVMLVAAATNEHRTVGVHDFLGCYHRWTTAARGAIDPAG